MLFNDTTAYVQLKHSAARPLFGA